MKNFITGLLAIVLVAAPAQALGQSISSKGWTITAPKGGVMPMSDDTCLGC